MMFVPHDLDHSPAFEGFPERAHQPDEIAMPVVDPMNPRGMSLAVEFNKVARVMMEANDRLDNDMKRDPREVVLDALEVTHLRQAHDARFGLDRAELFMELEQAGLHVPADVKRAFLHETDLGGPAPSQETPMAMPPAYMLSAMQGESGIGRAASPFNDSRLVAPQMEAGFMERDGPSSVIAPPLVPRMG